MQFPGLNTTAGSFSLLKSIVPEDAGVIKRLRAAGALILGTVIPNSLFERVTVLTLFICLFHRKGKLIRMGALQRQSCVWVVRKRWTGYKRILPKRRSMWFVFGLWDCCFNWARSGYFGHRNRWKHNMSNEQQ